jgi:acetyl-CoA carboxylase carboxyl transferase subunit alpha
MLQYSTYSVISPEGCASILWKDGSQADRAAAALGVTADNALRLGVIDEIIPEPLGGAHWKPAEAISTLGNALEKHLLELGKMSSDQLRRQRNQKFAAMGRVEAREPVSPFRTDAAPKTEWMQSWEQLSRSTTFAGDVTPG